MRRPSPLPPPPARPAPPEAPSVEATSLTGASGLGEADKAAVHPDHGLTAPIIPLAVPTADADADHAPAQSYADDIDGAYEGDVGVRDVWRASRARRKALRSEVRRFTGRQRRRRMVWIGALASLIVLVVATLGAAYSPLLAVEEIVVVGAERLDAEEVSDALSSQLNTPLPLVDESAIKAALVEFPLIESYTLEARPPHELVVQLVERTPVGLIESAAGYTLVDAAGVALATTENRESDEPIIEVTGGTDSDAFHSVGQVIRSLPDSILERVTSVSASSPNDVTLTFGGTNTDVVWGSAEDSALKAFELEKIMQTRAPEDVLTYDVSSPSAIVVL
ncbi:FtsQ-type POTRA domain-containing protein [Microbacterium sp. NPDC076911]|uniref:FtsQ-type POTRA domain-containing protein n=1 Tax=Microbacterium sp. NPDC076911 TaxID=3154958 RepID=UPI0034286ECF